MPLQLNNSSSLAAVLAQPLKMIRFNGGRAAEPEPAASDQVDREGEEDDVAVRPERGRDGDGPDQGGDVVALERPAQGRDGAGWGRDDRLEDLGPRLPNEPARDFIRQ